VVPERIVNDPRLADLIINQLVIEDGWIAVALGPGRIAATRPKRPRRAAHQLRAGLYIAAYFDNNKATKSAACRQAIAAKSRALSGGGCRRHENPGLAGRRIGDDYCPRTRATPRNVGPEQAVAAVERTIEKLLKAKAIAASDIMAIGIAIPGVVDPDEGRIVFTANMT